MLKTGDFAYFLPVLHILLLLVDNETVRC